MRKEIKAPYKLASREFRQENTIININDSMVGNGSRLVIAGPCFIESEEQIVGIAEYIKEKGANILSGGVYKYGTSPYKFQNTDKRGLEYLLTAKKITGLPVAAELMNMDTISLFEDVDIIQIGAENMQNFSLLKEVGKLRKPILLLRGMANTLEEMLLSSEYILNQGNGKVILCERGIRTFEHMTRNTLDIAAIPMLKQLSHLPVIVDPTYVSGTRSLVEPLVLASIAAGADGFMIAVHNNDQEVVWEERESISLEQFSRVKQKAELLL